MKKIPSNNDVKNFKEWNFLQPRTLGSNSASPHKIPRSKTPISLSNFKELNFEERENVDKNNKLKSFITIWDFLLVSSLTRLHSLSGFVLCTTSIVNFHFFSFFFASWVFFSFFFFEKWAYLLLLCDYYSFVLLWIQFSCAFLSTLFSLLQTYTFLPRMKWVYGHMYVVRFGACRFGDRFWL